MTTLNTLAASAPAGKWPVVLLEIPDLNGGDPLRYANDLVDWTVTLEAAAGGGVVTFPATGHKADAPSADDSASEQVAFEVPDPDGELHRRIVANIGNSVPLRVIQRKYLSTSPEAPQTVRILELAGPRRSVDGQSVSFVGQTLDPINRSAKLLEFTYDNAPGLRGRK